MAIGDLVWLDGESSGDDAAHEVGWEVSILAAEDATEGSPYVPPAQALGVVGVTAALAFGAIAVPSRS